MVGAHPALKASSLVGTDLDVLIDRADDETGEPVGRSHREAPEIDGVVRVAGAFARPGARAVELMRQASGAQDHDV